MHFKYHFLFFFTCLTTTPLDPGYISCSEGEDTKLIVQKAKIFWKRGRKKKIKKNVDFWIHYLSPWDAFALWLDRLNNITSRSDRATFKMSLELERKTKMSPSRDEWRELSCLDTDERTFIQILFHDTKKRAKINKVFICPHTYSVFLKSHYYLYFCQNGIIVMYMTIYY